MPTHNLTVEHVPVGDLRTYHRNPRKGNTAVIAQSLTVNGMYRPVCVNRGTHTGRPDEVLAGNHTLMAARDLGWDTIAVTYIDVDDDQAARIVAVDNRSADLATYDDRLLLELLADLPDLDGTGYDPGDIEDLEKSLRDTNPPDPGLTDPDDVPDPPLAPISKTGDVWILGDHRLAVGDAKDPHVWEALLSETKADCMWTDPPYGVSYVGKTGDALTIDNDDLSPAVLDEFLRTVLGTALVSCKPGAGWCSGPAGPATPSVRTCPTRPRGPATDPDLGERPVRDGPLRLPLPPRTYLLRLDPRRRAPRTTRPETRHRVRGPPTETVR